MNWLDLCLIAYIGIKTLSGYRIGFIKSFFNLTGFIIAIIVARFYHHIVSSVISSSSLGEKIRLAIYDKVSSVIDSNMAVNQPSTLGMGDALDFFKMPGFLKSSMLVGSNNTTAVTLGRDNMIEYISNTLSSITITIISIVILFIAVRIIVSIIAAMLNDIARLPILKQVNQAGGIIMGFVVAILTVMILFSILTPFLSFDGNTGIGAAISSSLIGRQIYYNNFILHWIVNIAFRALV